MFHCINLTRMSRCQVSVFHGLVDLVAANVLQGAVENLLERSSYVQLFDGSVVELDSKAKAAILNSLNELSSAALRVLGFAYKEDPPEFTTYNGDEDHPAHNLLLDPANYSSIESNLVFAGLAGLRVSAYILFFWSSISYLLVFMCLQ